MKNRQIMIFHRLCGRCKALLQKEKASQSVRVPKIGQRPALDRRKVKRLFLLGWKRRSIAKKLGYSYEYIKTIVRCIGENNMRNVPSLVELAKRGIE